MLLESLSLCYLEMPSNQNDTLSRRENKSQPNAASLYQTHHTEVKGVPLSCYQQRGLFFYNVRLTALH